MKITTAISAMLVKGATNGFRFMIKTRKELIHMRYFRE